MPKARNFMHQILGFSRGWQQRGYATVDLVTLAQRWHSSRTSSCERISLAISTSPNFIPTMSPSCMIPVNRSRCPAAWLDVVESCRHRRMCRYYLGWVMTEHFPRRPSRRGPASPKASGLDSSASNRFLQEITTCTFVSFLYSLRDWSLVFPGSLIDVASSPPYSSS